MAAGLRSTAVEVLCGFSVASVRSDNSSREAECPVALFSPAGKTVFGAAVDVGNAADYNKSKNPSLRGGTHKTPLNPENRGREPGDPSGSSRRSHAGDPSSAPTPLAAQTPAAPQRGSPSAMTASLSLWRCRRGGVLCVKRAVVAFAPVAVFAEELAIRKLVAFAREAAEASSALPAAAGGSYSIEPAAAVALGPTQRTILATSAFPGSATMLLSSCPDVLGLLGRPSKAGEAVAAAGSRPRLKLYIEHMSISPLKLSISFIPAPWHHQDFVAPGGGSKPQPTGSAAL